MLLAQGSLRGFALVEAAAMRGLLVAGIALVNINSVRARARNLGASDCFMDENSFQEVFKWLKDENTYKRWASEREQHLDVRGAKRRSLRI